VCVIELQWGLDGLVQSASTLQPPDGSHVPSVLHAPERHTLPPLVIEQGPSPFA
jgi:hypothetical protein